MATPEQKMQDELEFDSAYGADDAQAGPAQTDDDAFGLTPEVAAVEEDDGIPNSPEEATEVMPTEDTSEAKADPAMDAMHAEMARETQRLKSWEGRLKVLEAKLKAGGSPEPDGEGADQSMMDDEAESGMQDDAQDMADKIKGMSPDEAMQALTDDFGEDFAKMLSTVIDAKVAQASSSMGQSVDEIINDIVDSKAKMHFETIADRHPDFMDVSRSPEFTAFISAMPDAGQAESRRVVDSGTAREICKMLDAFKAAVQQTAVDETRQATDNKMDNKMDNSSADMDAAEGVRSSGMRLPVQPGASKDYSAAWEEFAD